MRSFEWLAALALTLVTPACSTPHPVAPLGHVSEPHALRVNFQPNRGIRIDFGGQPRTRAELTRAFDGAEDALTTFNSAIGDTLRRAGYQVSENGPHDARVVCDLSFSIEARQRRHGSVGSSELVRVVFHVYAPNGDELDRFALRSIDDAMPLGSSESIAVDLVNAMVQSPKLGRYAEARKTAPEAND